MMSRTSASLRRSLRSGLIAAPASATGPARRQLLPAAGSPHRVRWLSSDALAGVARVKELQQQVAALVRARDWEAARDAGEECRAALETLTGKRHPGYASALNNLVSANERNLLSSAPTPHPPNNNVTHTVSLTHVCARTPAGGEGGAHFITFN